MTLATPQEKASNFAASVTKGNDIVYDLRAHLNDEDRYFIIKIAPAKHQAFLKAAREDSGFRLEDFGEILHRGWDEPPYEVKLKYDQLYGMYPDIEEMVESENQEDS